MSATQTLDAIRTGGQQLLVLVRMRMREAEDALAEGKFELAMDRLDEARGLLGPLAQAEHFVAIADDSYLVRAFDLEAGMDLVNIGIVDAVMTEPCADHGNHVKVTVGERELGFDTDTQLYVRRPE